MLDLFGSRPADQMVARVVRITLAGASYELPVLSMRENREWKEQLNARTAASLDAVKDTEDLATVLRLLTEQTDEMLDLLYLYDLTNVLPQREEIESVRPDPSLDVMNAVRAIWRAANPGLGIAEQTVADAMPTSPSSPPTSTPPASTTSRRKRSKTN